MADSIGTKTVAGAVGVAVTAIAAALAGDLPWWGALLGVASGAVAIGLRAALGKLPGQLADALLQVFAEAAGPDALAKRVPSLTPEERAQVRAALDAADAGKK